MRALILYAGNRIGKNTDRLTKHITGVLNKEQYEIIRYDLKNLKIDHCTGCNACSEKGFCIIEDDMKVIYQEFDTADLVVFASPLYFNSVTSLGKTMIDRCQVYWGRKFGLGLYKTKIEKRGILISTCGTKITEKTFLGFDSVCEIFFKSIDVKGFQKFYLGNTDEAELTDESISAIDISV